MPYGLEVGALEAVLYAYDVRGTVGGGGSGWCGFGLAVGEAAELVAPDFRALGSEVAWEELVRDVFFFFFFCFSTFDRGFGRLGGVASELLEGSYVDCVAA